MNIQKKKKKKSIAVYKILMDYNVKTMNRDEVRKLISQINELEFKRDGSNTTDMFGGDDTVKKKISLKKLRTSLINRIDSFFESGATVHSTDYGFWKCYIKFCKTNIRNEVSELYTKCLAIHGGRRPSLWCAALHWTNKFTGNQEQLNDLFQEACKHHPKSENIHTTYFGLVLKEIGPVMNKCSTLGKLLAIYESAKTNIDSIAPILSFLKQCEDIKYREFTAHIQHRMMMQIMAMETLSEEIWDFLAQRELAGLNMCNFEKLSPMKANKDTKVAETIQIDTQHNVGEMEGKIFEDRPMDRRIELCSAVYLTAVLTLKTEKMAQMYIDAMIEINRDRFEYPILKHKKLVQAFKHGHELGIMNEEHYYALIQLFCERKSTIPLALEVLPIAVEHHSSIRLYRTWISCLIVEDQEPQILKVLRLANRRLKTELTVPIWKVVILYYGTLGQKYRLTCQKLQKEACRCMDPSFAVFRSMYLDWCMAYLKIENTRTQYDAMCEFPPASYGLHKTMAKIELCVSKQDQNHERMRLCYENAIRDFGKENIVVWIDYMKHETKHGDRKNVNRLCERAAQTLKPDLVKHFEKILNLKRTT